MIRCYLFPVAFAQHFPRWQSWGNRYAGRCCLQNLQKWYWFCQWRELKWDTFAVLGLLDSAQCVCTAHCWTVHIDKAESCSCNYCWCFCVLCGRLCGCFKFCLMSKSANTDMLIASKQTKLKLLCLWLCMNKSKQTCCCCGCTWRRTWRTHGAIRCCWGWTCTLICCFLWWLIFSSLYNGHVFVHQPQGNRQNFQPF